MHSLAFSPGFRIKIAPGRHAFAAAASALGLRLDHSGMGAMLSDILTQYGPDSRTGLVASAMMGSGETILYTCAVYLSAAGISKSRYIIPVALTGWLAGCIMAGLFFPESFA